MSKSEPGAPAVKWEMLTVGMYQENCYLLWRDGADRCVLVDPGDEAERIAARLEHLGLRPEVMLLTHGHCDHIGAVGEMKQRFGIPILIGAGEEGMLTDPIQNLSAMLATPIIAPPADQLVRAGDILSFVGINIMVVSTPGHSAASVSYLIPSGSLVLSGDVLFAGSIGRTDLPGGNFDILMQSIDRELLTLPDDTLVLPGHGPVTTIGRERRSNPFLLERHYG